MRSALRASLPAVVSLAVLCTGAAAQAPSGGGSNVPLLGFPLQQEGRAETYKRLPYRDTPDEIRIEVAADALYDFDRAEVRKSAADLMQQAANLIFEHAKGPVRIECRSDRSPAAAAQKSAAQCALALSQWLTVQERLTRVKFTTVGTSIAPPGPRDSRDIFAPAPVSQRNITIVFGKR